MKPEKDQTREMIEMMLSESGDQNQAKQFAAIACRYIINSNPHSTTKVPYCTKHYWESVLEQILLY